MRVERAQIFLHVNCSIDSVPAEPIQIEAHGCVRVWLHQKQY